MTTHDAPPARGKAALLWSAVRILAAPALLLVLFVVALGGTLQVWLNPREQYDEEAVIEWIREARVNDQTLRDLTLKYLDETRPANGAAADEFAASLRRQDIEEMLKALGTPPTKVYPGQLPLFPLVYRLEVRFHPDPGGPAEAVERPVVWESGLPRNKGQYRTLTEPIRLHDRASVAVEYSLHTFYKKQQEEQDAAERRKWAAALALVGTVPGVVWVWLVRRRERERERQQSLAQRKIDEARNLLLEEELRRREAEQQREEVQRELLTQQLAREAAERQALELRTQMFASIGIMAGSYAHNIKNLLVRPNDLLSRCLEGDGLNTSQKQMLNEVHQTLGTVTERLQQILRTVRRDPTRAELTQLDLNWVLGDLARTWQALALDKWKMNVTLQASPEPLWVEADLSHLQQAVENLLFNARDATFEMRNHLRAVAREKSGAEQKRALIAAAAWKGQVTLRCHRDGAEGVVEVTDNGIGMSEEVKARCLERHFSTKRDNALYEGNSTGMGLGLSFVAVILERHRAKLEIESEPLRGTTFRIRFPLKEAT